MLIYISRMTAAPNTCQGQSVCLCSNIYTLPRTTTSGGSTKTDCSCTIMPTELSCPSPTSSTMTASPTPAPTACVGGNGPLSLAASVMEFYIEHYCSGVANTNSNGETLNVTRTWPGGCALKLNDNQAIITSVSLDTTNEYCASKFNDQVGAFFSEADCNTAMSVDVNGCEFLVLKLVSSFPVLTGACR